MSQNNEIEELQKRIKQLQLGKVDSHNNAAKGYNLGMTIATELVAGVLVGVIIGVSLDKMFASKPLFLIICLFFGIIASVRVIWKKVSESNGA